MSNLSTYLDDHCAGARFAIETLRRLGESHRGTPLGDFSEMMRQEIDKDYVVLTEISNRLADDGPTIKEAISWLAERASRLKLQLGNDAQFAAFESLEILSLGVLGKQKLWQVLRLLSTQVSALGGLKYDDLIERAQLQHDEIESWHQTLAIDALGTWGVR